MREHHPELTATGFQVIVLTPSKREFLEKFIDAFGPYPFEIYGDPRRQLYRNMGHITMAKPKLLLKAAVGLLKGGTKAFMPADPSQKQIVQEAMKSQDIYIQGGTWIYDENGKVIWSHIDSSPEDHASISTILEKVK